MKYDPYNVSHPSGIPLAYQAATHDPDFGQDFAAAEQARAEESSRVQEAQADAMILCADLLDEVQEKIVEHFQDWTPCQMYGHNFGPDGCLDCGEDF